MKQKKIKIYVNNNVVDAEVKNDLHYLGGRKVIFKLPNGVVGHTSINLVKIVENEKVN